MMAEKILGVGFHKTATTSLGDAFEMLGCSRQGWDDALAMKFHRGEIDQLIELTDQFDALEDFPWPLLYKEIHQRHPNVKFILTKRKSMDEWLDSLLRHCDRHPPKESDFRRYLYGIDHPREDPEHVLSVHQKHMDDVRAYSAENGIPLLEVCFETMDGWDELCHFLDKPAPKLPLPKSNQDPARAKSPRRLRGLGRLRRLFSR